MIRHKLVIILFLGLSLAIAGRLIALQTKGKKFLTFQGDARVIRVVKEYPDRGMILDRNQEPLAVSTQTPSVWLNPQVFNRDNSHVAQLLKILNISQQQLLKKLSYYSDKEFMYLKRHVTPEDIERIVSLGIPGVNYTLENKRYYPIGEVGSHVLGLTDLDGKGISGLEYVYDEQLTGSMGKKVVIKDRRGREVEYIKHLQGMKVGENVVTSIDHRLQYLAHKELQHAIAKHQAKSGSVVILDVNTGEVLAMANQPTFNPNERITNINSSKYRNIAVTDYFEPASSVKAFSIASVLERGVPSEALVDTSPGVLQLRGGVVKDLKNHGVLNLAAILQHSSNIGISKLILSDTNINPADLLWNIYNRVGFGYTTSSGFPGESAGVLNLPNKNQQFVLATMSFGYGMAVTPLQLARAYAVLGSYGIRRPVSFLKLNEIPAGVQVMRPKVAEQILEMLALTASRNTYHLTKVEGYNVAGKTGTARKLVKNSYDKNKHLAVFCGLAPANAPKFSIVVTINEPSVSGYYGNQVAAPVFAKVVSGALSILNIPPDAVGVHVAQNEVKHS